MVYTISIDVFINYIINNDKQYINFKNKKIIIKTFTNYREYLNETKII